MTSAKSISDTKGIKGGMLGKITLGTKAQMTNNFPMPQTEMNCVLHGQNSYEQHMLKIFPVITQFVLTQID